MAADQDRDDAWDVEDSDDDSPIEIPEEYLNLNARTEQVTIIGLWQDHTHGKIQIEPDFQRHYVWDSSRASRFIESLLLGLPTPAIFMAEEPDGTWCVIDEHQRLETLFRYMQPLLKSVLNSQGVNLGRYGKLSPLVLNRLRVLTNLNGGNIERLSVADRDKLWKTELTVVRIPIEADPRMKYELFARLNQGSVSLNSQEIRNCLYRGKYNTLISTLGEEPRFLQLYGKNAPDKRMKHQELILRFFAFLHGRDHYRPPFRNFLNQEMEDNTEVSDGQLERFRYEFEAALLWNDRIFGKEVFRAFQSGTANRPVGRWGPRRYDLVYEVSMVEFATFADRLNDVRERLSASDCSLFQDELRHSLVGLMATTNWAATLRQNTTLPSVLNYRFDKWIEHLESALNDPDLAVAKSRARREALVFSGACLVYQQPLGADDHTWSATHRGNLVHFYCGASQIESLRG